MNAGARGRRPVLIFDSGVGGLSVLRDLRARLPALDVIYLGDNAFFPYGDLVDEQIVARVLRLVGDAETQFRPRIIVIACNTASTLVLDQLRARVKVPVVGVVPAIKPAAALTVSGRIGLLATPATVRRPYLDALIREHARDKEVLRVGSSALVQQAERWLAGQLLDRALISQSVQPLVEAKVDTVVLGCTHFPLIRQALFQALPEVLHWVDSGEAIARRVEYLLSQAARLIDPQRPSQAVPSEPEEALIHLLFTGTVPADLSGFLLQCGYSSQQWQASRV